MADDWDVEVQVKPNHDIDKKLAHHPAVVAHLTDIATKTAAAANAGHQPGRYGIRVQNWPNTRRARAFAIPTDNGGIHLELTQSLLLKAAGSTPHQQLGISVQPSAGATAIADRGDGEFDAAVSNGTIGAVTEKGQG